jgi:phosphate starvation-inducible protein PhoH
MNIFGWPAERSTYHATNVKRVKSYLKRICVEAGEEKGFVPGRITDAWGYDKITKTIYFCEVKVNPNDLLKAVSQIHDTVFKFKPKDPKNKVIPVIAIPKRLYNDLVKYDVGQWRSFRSLCKTTNIAVWIIEQSNIVQIQGPKPKSPKTKTRKSSLKVKATTKRKITTKTKAAKGRKSSTNAKSKTKTIAKAKATKKRKPTAKKKTAKTRSKTVKKH